MRFAHLNFMSLNSIVLSCLEHCLSLRFCEVFVLFWLLLCLLFLFVNATAQRKVSPFSFAVLLKKRLCECSCAQGSTLIEPWQHSTQQSYPRRIRLVRGYVKIKIPLSRDAKKVPKTYSIVTGYCKLISYDGRQQKNQDTLKAFRMPTSMPMCTRQHINRALATFKTTIASKADQATSRVREDQDFFDSGRQ